MVWTAASGPGRSGLAALSSFTRDLGRAPPQERTCPRGPATGRLVKLRSRISCEGEKPHSSDERRTIFRQRPRAAPIGSSRDKRPSGATAAVRQAGLAARQTPGLAGHGPVAVAARRSPLGLGRPGSRRSSADGRLGGSRRGPQLSPPRPLLLGQAG
jgi:hypothetical protein